MDAKQLILDFQNKDKYDLCCSESIFYASAKYYDLDYNESTYKVAAAFCGGNLMEDTCGLLTASIAVIATIFVKENSHNSEEMKAHIVEFTNKFNMKFSSKNCKLLKNIYRSEEFGCKNLIVESFILLTSFIDSKLEKSS